MLYQVPFLANRPRATGPPARKLHGVSAAEPLIPDTLSISSSWSRWVRLSAETRCYGKGLIVREGYDAGLSGDSTEQWFQQVYDR